MAADSDTAPATVGGDPIVAEATRRFKRCAEWEATARINFLADYKFAHGDSDNGFQWPSTIRANRDTDSRPCLTMNVVRQHNLQIVNEAKQNKSSVAFKATGGAATKESADLYEAMFRRVEYISDAQAAYEMGCEFQVTGGIGWVRVVTEYENERTFNQDFRIKRVTDPLSIYMDMDIQEKSGADAKYAFVFDLVPDDDLYEAYPRLRGMGSLGPLSGGTSEDFWNIKDHTRVCEYFRKSPKADKLVSFINPSTGQRAEQLRSNLGETVYAAVVGLPLTKVRDVTRYEIEWFLIVGEKIVDRTVWPGKYIPLIRILGEETKIEGVLDRKGHTRSMKDAQRMYNYNASASVEFGALQSKTPWIVAARAIEEFESMWNTANTVNHSVLVYNHENDEGRDGVVPPPKRTDPPTSAPVFEAGMQTAFNQMMMTSGQWQNQMGMQGNERTGAAIDRRQEQGYTAVFHYQNNYADALKFIGKQFIDIVPKIYDTKRLLKLETADGEQFDLEIDPGARQALQVQMDKDEKIIGRVLNPGLGEYDVQSAVGPAYGTRRDETVRAMTLLLTQSPALVPLIGDLLLSAMDFKEAAEGAQRMKRMVPPQALGKGPTQTEQAQQEAIKALQEALTKALQQSGVDKIKMASKEELRDIEVYGAETDRLAVLTKLGIDQGQLQLMMHQLVHDTMNSHLDRIVQNNKQAGETSNVAGS